MASVGEGLGFTVETLKSFCKTISEKLSPSGMLSLISLIDDLNYRRIRQSEFSKSIQLLFENDGNIQQDVNDNELEEGEIREYHVFAVRAKVDDKSKEHPTHHGNLKVGADVGIRAKVDENPKEKVSDKRESEKHVTDVFNKMNLEGRKRIILHSEPIERDVNRPRKSRRLNRVTPSYKFIPEEDQCPVEDEVLNNQCSLIVFDDASRNNKLTKYEEALARCEDEMFEADMLMEPLRSAVESAEKVIEGKRKVKELEVLFYRSIEKLCRRDLSERVRQNHKQGVREILPRLKQKLNKLTIAREKQNSGWKKVIKENTAKQRELEAKQRELTGKKLKAKQQI